MADAQNDDDKVEATFVLLTEARKLESDGRHWPATEKYVEAHKLLEELAANNSTNGQDPQIAQLYASKADEYWSKSRQCLIQAMQEEQQLDEQDDPPNIRDLLDDEQAKIRNHSFSALFSKVMEKEPLPAAAEVAVEESTLAPQQNAVADADDLESRLRALNQSLPSGLKTMDERMSDVHKGMGNLGMSSIYTQPKKSYSHTIMDDELSKSEDEQIDEILAQAKDEVLMDKMDQENNDKGAIIANKTNNTDNDADDDGSSLASSSSTDSEGDELLDHDQLGMKVIHKKLVKAQVKLAEALALVDQARTKRKKEDQDEEEAIYQHNAANETSDDEDSFREVQTNDVAFLMMNGKRKLKSAQRDLKKALAEWQELIL